MARPIPTAVRDPTAATVQAFWLSIGATGLWLVTLPLLQRGRVVTLAVALGCHLNLVWRERRDPAVTARMVGWAAFGLVVLAVALPPFGSKDIWSYAMYGRIVGIHHANPYTTAPAVFPADPLLSRVNVLFRTTPSVYGPVFTAVAGLGALVYGSSPLLARLFFQGLAGASLLAVIALLVRRRVATWVICLIGLAPAAVVVVNGAHLDLVVGLGVLLALLLIDEERVAAGGVVLAVASMVKVIALPAAGGIVVALLLARRRRDAAVVTASTAIAMVLGYASVGGRAALVPVSHAARYVSVASLAGGARQLELHLHAGPWPVLAQPGDRSLAAAALAGVAFATYTWRHRRAADPASFAVAAMIFYLLTANYSLAWYPMAMIPAAGLVSDRLRWSGFAVLVGLMLVDARYLTVTDLWTWVVRAGPVLALVLLATLAWHVDERPERHDPPVPLPDYAGRGPV